MDNTVDVRKASVEDIRARFERMQAVEHFSNLEIGQQTAMDSTLLIELTASAAARTTPHAGSMLDIGCGAGNYTLKLLDYFSDLDCTLLDVSRAMLERARERVHKKTDGRITILHGDIRNISLQDEQFDIVISGTALHHLRAKQEWERVFQKVFRSLKSGGTFWISDLVAHENPIIHELMFGRYGQYLENQGGSSFRENVFRVIAEEDTPRSIEYQIHLLEKTGFTNITILHKNACFAAFGGMKD